MLPALALASTEVKAEEERLASMTVVSQLALVRVFAQPEVDVDVMGWVFRSVVAAEEHRGQEDGRTGKERCKSNKRDAKLKQGQQGESNEWPCW